MIARFGIPPPPPPPSRRWWLGVTTRYHEKLQRTDGRTTPGMTLTPTESASRGAAAVGWHRRQSSEGTSGRTGEHTNKLIRFSSGRLRIIIQQYPIHSIRCADQKYTPCGGRVFVRGPPVPKPAQTFNIPPPGFTTPAGQPGCTARILLSAALRSIRATTRGKKNQPRGLNRFLWYCGS